jgi:iron complex transport system substrate-binding protein
VGHGSNPCRLLHIDCKKGWLAVMPSSLLMPVEDVVTRRAFVAGVAAAGLVACGRGREPGFSSAAPGFPRSVDHAVGRAEISAPPVRVVAATDYDDLDAVLAVGLAPVAFGFSPWLVPDLPPWASGAAGSTRLVGQVAEVSLEKIAAQNPDLIVGQADLVSGTIDELSRIAPTVTVALRSGDWRAGTRIVGLATAREAQAAAAIAQAERAVAAAAARLADLPGRRVAVLSRHGGEIQIQSASFDRHGAGALLADLGLDPVDVSGGAGTVAEEELTRLDDVDVLLVLDFVAETDMLLASPVFRMLRPVREGRVARLGPAASRGSYLLSTLSAAYAADEFATAITAASRREGR